MTLAVAHAGTKLHDCPPLHTLTHTGTHITQAIAHTHPISHMHATTHTQAHTQPRSQYLTHNHTHTQPHGPLFHPERSRRWRGLGLAPCPQPSCSQGPRQHFLTLSTITSHFPHSRGQQATAHQPPQTNPDRGE